MAVTDEIQKIVFTVSNFFEESKLGNRTNIKELFLSLQATVDIKVDRKLLYEKLHTLVTTLQKIQNDMRNSDEMRQKNEPIELNIKQEPKEEKMDVETEVLEQKPISLLRTRGPPKKTFRAAVPKTELPETDPNLVQVQAKKTEIERRINAFIERKQNVLDEENRREFCNTVISEEVACEGCARVNAVFVSRKGGKSHVRIFRAINELGPQSKQRKLETSSAASSDKTKIPDSIQERLSNMESHLQLKTVLKQDDVYQRIRSLEDRILQLESLSPEYFTNQTSQGSRNKAVQRLKEGQNISNGSSLSLLDIEAKMQELKQSLLQQENLPERDDADDTES